MFGIYAAVNSTTEGQHALVRVNTNFNDLAFKKR